MYAGFPLADIFASSMAQAGMYEALYHRERTGEGARIDIALLDGAVALNELSLIMTGVLGEIPPPGLHGFTAPFGVYKAADGYVVVGVLGEPVWERFATAIGSRTSSSARSSDRESAVTGIGSNSMPRSTSGCTTSRWLSH